MCAHKNNPSFSPGFDIFYDTDKMTYFYPDGVFGPEVEIRRLDDIRKSLLDYHCSGPNKVYAIAMDVGRTIDKADLINRNLLYGTVIYAKGKLGQEPIRSQGHVHAVSKSCNMSTPEVYEIWSGRAIVYMQEKAENQPGRCYAVEGKPRDIIIVPPGWAHATISADPNHPLVFGAWCVRDYGFDYQDVRAHKGLAYYPKLNVNNEILWLENEQYEKSNLIVKAPRKYHEFSIDNEPIYSQYLKDKERFMFVSHPELKSDIWSNFIP